MSDNLLAAIISAATVVCAAAVTIFLTKQKEREAAWRDKQLQYYEEFFQAVSRIADTTVLPEDHIRYANAFNNLHLIAGSNVLSALHAFSEEIAVSNKNRSQERHDVLWSRLVWEIRRDLKVTPVTEHVQFKARLWSSGVQRTG